MRDKLTQSRISMRSAAISFGDEILAPADSARFKKVMAKTGKLVADFAGEVNALLIEWLDADEAVRPEINGEIEAALAELQKLVDELRNEGEETP